jgi:cytochrome c5
MNYFSAMAMCIGVVIATSGTSMADDGADTYKLVCSSCHESGAVGAPRLEDKVEWIHRINQGMDALYASTVNGKCELSVKVLREDLSDEVIKDAVDYMVFQARQPSPFQN